MKQSSGHLCEWENENFAPFNIDGLNQSQVTCRNLWHFKIFGPPK